MVTNELGTKNISVSYTSAVPGQSITLTDSNNVFYCYNTSGGSGTYVFTSVAISDTYPLTLLISDGNC
jgi:hypothetical protein